MATRKKQLIKKIIAPLGTIILLIVATIMIIYSLVRTGEINIEDLYGPYAIAIYMIIGVAIIIGSGALIIYKMWSKYND